MIKQINVTCEKCKENFILTSESSFANKVLDEGHYICFTCEDKLSVEILQEELESCIQTLISVSILANGDENIVIGNFVDSKLSKLAKTHENVTKYIEKVTGKNIDVVLAENAALEAEEEE